MGLDIGVRLPLLAAFVVVSGGDWEIKFTYLIASVTFPISNVRFLSGNS